MNFGGVLRCNGHRTGRRPEGHRRAGARQDVLRPGRPARPLPGRLYAARVRHGIRRTTACGATRYRHRPSADREQSQAVTYRGVRRNAPGPRTNSGIPGSKTRGFL
jgi:hypothetical protein